MADEPATTSTSRAARGKQPGPRWPTVGVALLLLVLGTFCRLTGAESVFEGERVHLLGADSHYHAQRIRSALRVWPSIDSLRDRALAHPGGYDVNWPPGFDWLAAATARLLGQTRGDGPARAGTIFVVALGALSALVVLGAGRRLGLPLAWAFLAALFAGLVPIALEYSRVGRVDHHVAETLFSGLLPLLHLWVLGALEQDGAALARRPKGCLRPRARALLAGAALGAPFWLWPSALVTSAWWIVIILVDGWWRGDPARARLVALELAVALAVVAPLAWLMPDSLRWSLASPSAAHVQLVALALLAALWLSFLAGRAGDAAGWSQRRRLVCALGFLALATLLLLSPLVASFAELFAFGRRAGLWGLVLEQRPLFSLPLAQQVLLGSYLVYASAPLALVAIWRGDDEVRLWAAFALPLLALGLLQVRFLASGLLLAAPLAALGLRELTRLLTARWKSPGLARAAPLLAAAIWLAALGSSVLDYTLGGRYVPSALRLAHEDAARWLRDARGKGEAALVPLNLGQLVANLADTPVVGSTVIVAGTRRANRQTVAFYAQADSRSAEALLRHRRVRWVLGSRFPRRRFARYLAWLEDRRPSPAALARRYRRCLAVRLLADSAAAARVGTETLPPLRWLQHRYEVGRRGGHRRGRRPPLVQLFRRVLGARLRGSCRAGETVRVLLPLVTGRGRRFGYRDATLCGANARFVLRLPYATEPAHGLVTGARGPLVVARSAGKVSVQVSLAAVERGSTVAVP